MKTRAQKLIKIGKALDRVNAEIDRHIETSLAHYATLKAKRLLLMQMRIDLLAKGGK